MPAVETPIRRITGGLPAPYDAEPDDRDAVGAGRSIDIPPAFYRDADVPPPPPDDPHWREWYHGNDREPVSRLILLGLPICLAILGVLHILLILLILHLSAPGG